MKTIWAATISLFLVWSTVEAVSQQRDNPTSVWCDYHNTYAQRSGKEYPNGVCYDVYKHYVFQDGKSLTHKLTMKCAK